MISISYPWLFMLLPLPWLLLATIPPKQIDEAAVRVPFGDRIRSALRGSGHRGAKKTSRPFYLVLGVIWVLFLLALVRPQWIEPPEIRNLPMRDLLLLVDLSGSMQQEDFTSETGERVDRLRAVKQVLGDFLERRDGDRVGLVVFGDAPYLQAPFSEDLQLSRQLLEETAIGMAGPRTAFGDAIGLGISLFEASDAPAKTMIALTDGNDTASQVPPTEASRVARERGIRVHTVAIGDPTTVGEEKLDEVTLREVAQITGGSYFFGADRAELAGIYAELDRIETRQVSVVSHRARREIYYWPLLAALAVWLVRDFWVSRRAAQVLHVTMEKPSVRVNPITGELQVKS